MRTSLVFRTYDSGEESCKRRQQQPDRYELEICTYPLAEQLIADWEVVSDGRFEAEDCMLQLYGLTLVTSLTIDSIGAGVIMLIRCKAGA